MRSLRAGLENIGGDQDDGVGAVVAVPVNGLAVFASGVAGTKRLRGAVVTDDGVGPLHEIDYGRPLLVIMEPDVPSRLDGQHAQAQLPARHRLELGSQLDNGRLADGVSLVVLRSFLGAGDRHS